MIKICIQIFISTKFIQCMVCFSVFFHFNQLQNIVEYVLSFSKQNSTRNSLAFKSVFVSHYCAFHISNMFDQWLGFYRCMYCNREYEFSNIAKLQLRQCPSCLNYNSPKNAVSYLIENTKGFVNEMKLILPLITVKFGERKESGQKVKHWNRFRLSPAK